MPNWEKILAIDGIDILRVLPPTLCLFCLQWHKFPRSMLHPRLQRIFSIMTTKTSVEQSELELVNVGAQID